MYNKYIKQTQTYKKQTFGDNMKVYEINPFIRFAKAIRLLDSTENTSSRDSRLFYVLNGNARLVINDTQYTLSQDSAIIFPNGTVYRFDIDNPLKLISINFDYTQNNRNMSDSLFPVAADRFKENMKLENIFFEDADILNYPIKIDKAFGLRDKLEKITNVYKKREIYYIERCSALLKDTVIDILQSALFTSQTVLNTIEKVIKYIQSNYSCNITNTDIAETVNYHPYHLNRLMIKYTGFTLHQYLLNVRLEMAKEYLLNTTYSLSVIAEKCGFSSPGHFSSTFNKTCGLSPRAYREMNRNIL